MIPFIDLHCDTLSHCLAGRHPASLAHNSLSVDFARMKQSGALAQFFSLFPWPQELDQRCAVEIHTGWDWVLLAARRMEEELRAHKDLVSLCKNGQELAKNRKDGLPSVILTLEGADPVNADMNRIDALYDLGVRLITLTWNYANCMGFPGAKRKEEMSGGLTPFGFDAVSRMNELGVLVDVSHLSDAGFSDVLRISHAPVVASHSNARALSPNPRNLSDGMIRALAGKGGLIGLNFNGPFLCADAKSKSSRISDMVRHARHITDVGGMECLALGSDFDGIEGDLEISDILQTPRLLHALRAAGFSEEDVEKIAWKNTNRLISDVMM